MDYSEYTIHNRQLNNSSINPCILYSFISVFIIIPTNSLHRAVSNWRIAAVVVAIAVAAILKPRMEPLATVLSRRPHCKPQSSSPSTRLFLLKRTDSISWTRAGPLQSHKKKKNTHTGKLPPKDQTKRIPPQMETCRTNERTDHRLIHPQHITHLTATSSGSNLI